jgi:hypothetical protein
MANMNKKDYDKNTFKNKDVDVLSDKQKRIASQTPPYHKITGSDFKKLQSDKNKNA